MKYLTIEDVCEMLSISRSTLERMRGKKSLLSVPLNGEDFSTFSKPRMRKDDPTRVQFPEPDLFIGKSPRWEQDSLIEWLREHGSKL